jgi:sulfite exporter TauE/SafE
MTKLHRAANCDDENSPARRLLRYRQQLIYRAEARMMHLGALLVMLMLTCAAVVQLDTSVGGLIVSLGTVPLMLLGGDIYERVRDFIENRLYCPCYDKASQNRPAVHVDPNRTDVMNLRFAIYIIVSPVLPTVFLTLACSYGLLHLPSILPIILGAWLVAMALSLIFGVLRVVNYPMSWRRMLQPLARIPNPDVH